MTVGILDVWEGRRGKNECGWGRANGGCRDISVWRDINDILGKALIVLDKMRIRINPAIRKVMLIFLIYRRCREL